MKKIILSLVSFLGLNSVVQAAVDLATFKTLAGGNVEAGKEILKNGSTADKNLAECFPAYLEAKDRAAAKAAQEAALREEAAAKAAQEAALREEAAAKAAQEAALREEAAAKAAIDKEQREAAEKKAQEAARRAQEDAERAAKELAAAKAAEEAARAAEARERAAEEAARAAEAQVAIEATAVAQAAIEAAAVEVAVEVAAQVTEKIEDAKAQLKEIGVSQSAIKAFEDSVEAVINDGSEETAATKFAKALMEATHRPINGADGKPLKGSEEAAARQQAIAQLKEISGYNKLSAKEQKEFDAAFNELNKDKQSKSWYQSKKAVAAVTLVAVVILASIAAYYKGLITKEMGSEIYKKAMENLSSAKDALGKYYTSAAEALKKASGNINQNSKFLYTAAIKKSKDAYKALGETSAKLGSSLWEGTKSAWNITSGLARSAGTAISNVAIVSSAVASAKKYFLGSNPSVVAAEDSNIDSDVAKAANAAVETQANSAVETQANSAVETQDNSANAAFELAQKNAARNQDALNRGPGMKR